MAHARKHEGLKGVSLIVLSAGLLMGNQKCETPADADRQLRMDVEVGKMNARPIRLPNGELVDFPYVVDTLFYRQVMNSKNFHISSATGGSLAQSSSLASSMASSQANSARAASKSAPKERHKNLTSSDTALLESFGFITQRVVDANPGKISEPGKLSLKSEALVSEAPACLYNMPMGRLSGDVISFQATWGAGVGIGYGANGSALPGGAAGSVDFSRSRLDLGMRFDDPLKGLPVAISDGISHQSNVKFGFSFNPGVPVGFTFFFNTAISDVIKTAMDRGLDALVKTYTEKIMGRGKTWNEAWEARVLFDPVISDEDNFVAFQGGTFHGIEVGDKFNVANMHYQWKGEPCKSELRYKIPLSDPFAELEVIRVSDTISVARVTNQPEKRIIPGAQVKIMQLKLPELPKK